MTRRSTAFGSWIERFLFREDSGKRWPQVGRETQGTYNQHGWDHDDGDDGDGDDGDDDGDDADADADGDGDGDDGDDDGGDEDDDSMIRWFDDSMMMMHKC